MNLTKCHPSSLNILKGNKKELKEDPIKITNISVPIQLAIFILQCLAFILKKARP